MSRNPITIRFDSDLLAEAESHIEREGIQKAEFFERAVSEYLDVDRNARIEQKLDGLIEALGESPPDLRENRGVKEKESAPSKTPDRSNESDESEQEPRPELSDDRLETGPLDISNSQTDGKANRMVNYLVLEFQENSAPLISFDKVQNAIEELGGSSDYYLDTYYPLIKERFEQLGWYYNPLRRCWYDDVEIFRSHLSGQWAEAKRIATGEIGLGDRDSADVSHYERITENRGDVLDLLARHDIDDVGEIEESLKHISRYVKRLQKSRQKAWGH